jgi:hypothetical protein
MQGLSTALPVSAKVHSGHHRMVFMTGSRQFFHSP